MALAERENEVFLKHSREHYNLDHLDQMARSRVDCLLGALEVIADLDKQQDSQKTTKPHVAFEPIVPTGPVEKIDSTDPSMIARNSAQSASDIHQAFAWMA
jgi:hypothetical protein